MDVAAAAAFRRRVVFRQKIDSLLALFLDKQTDI